MLRKKHREGDTPLCPDSAKNQHLAAQNHPSSRKILDGGGHEASNLSWREAKGPFLPLNPLDPRASYKGDRGLAGKAIQFIILNAVLVFDTASIPWAETTILVEHMPFASAIEAATAEERVNWLDADTSDDNACTELTPTFPGPWVSWAWTGGKANACYQLVSRLTYQPPSADAS